MAASISMLALVAMVGSGATANAPSARASTSAGADLVSFRVPSPSMLPKLKVGSTIIVDLHAYVSKKPRIGDIVVFHPPAGATTAGGFPVCGNPSEGQLESKPCGVPTTQESKQKFLERVVGLPGDRISIVNGHVIRNGVREHDPYVKACTGPACNFPKPVVIRRGDYFTMGDNRGASDDGRFWGPVHKSWILGKVIRVVG
jgi:signal peptidase I